MAEDNNEPPPKRPIDVFPADDGAPPSFARESRFDPRPPGVGARAGPEAAPPPMPPPGAQPSSAGNTAGPSAAVGGFAAKSSYEGNYLLTVGKGQSGKSTFQRQLAMSLLTSTDLYSAELLTGGDWTARGMVTEWMAQYKHSRTFPAPTKVDEITEFHFRVTPHGRRKWPLDFCFLEISGETFVEFQLFGADGPAIVPSLSFLLGSPKVRPVFALMLDGEDPEGRRSSRRVGDKQIHLLDDGIFANFLAYAGQLRGRFQEVLSVAILVSKPEAAIGDHLARQTAASEERQNALYNFARSALPQTFGVLSDPARRMECVVFGVSIGEVVANGGERYVAHATFDDTQDIFAWLYGQFSQKSIVPLHSRIFRALTGGE